MSHRHAQSIVSRRVSSPRRWPLALAIAAACGVTAPLMAQPSGPEVTPERKALRVCQDPNNLPFANDKGQGFENRIAELFGKSLGLPVTYYNYPQRYIFIRNTLRHKLPGEDYPCDIIMGLPVGFGQTAVTKPYFSSPYVLVFPAGKGLDDVRSSDDFLALEPAKLAKLKIGVFDQSPASRWMARHNLVDQGVPYHTINMEMDYYPGRIIDQDLASGKIDVAIVWGPVGSYYGKAVAKQAMHVVPIRPEPGIPLDFAVGMGVRYGEPEWKKQVEQFIDTHTAEIRAILTEYQVPMSETPVPATSQKN
ncbi:MAG: quinoprotein dehydrogenase-associated putative ABC transporter substrate-binding protein [Thauera sp.]|nr:quinoprotein dehydrogenase-associated putative ABC transporter substrate-binding protein [Thauera sp.]